jgi:membrane protein DedA with SNARE-associated domain
MRLLLSLAIGTLVSEDLSCISAGLLVARGELDFFSATLACFLGIWIGDALIVLAGRMLGRRALNHWPLRGRFTPESLARAETWFARRGARLALTSRFLPGTRLPTYLAAGMLRAPLGPFLGWLALACAIWTPLLVGAAALAGDAAERWLGLWERGVPLLLAVAVLLWLLVRLALALGTWRGRRLALGKWRRLTRWEFWPRWAVYPPIVAYITAHGVRMRRLTWFTAVNPGIGAGGGLVGESKSEILASLGGPRVAPWTLIAAGAEATRRAALDAFFAERGLSFPVVLKPDQGERGQGVVIARDRAAAEAKLRDDPAALIAQAYVPGREFGVFYWRHPKAETGEIFAITDKRLITVTGDGRRTLETLILADDRAVCMGNFFLKNFGARLDAVPAAGEVVALTELGTHCRGALFLDGAELITPALRAEIDCVSRRFAGFYFGRYDVRAPSAEALARGEFTVLELNGVTSEATSIYDPRHSVWRGWAVLLRQWRIAARIADANLLAGARPLSARATIALARTAGKTRPPTVASPAAAGDLHADALAER